MFLCWYSGISYLPTHQILFLLHQSQVVLMILTKGYLISLILGNVSIDSFLFFVTRSHARQGSMKRQLATEDLFLGNLDFL